MAQYANPNQFGAPMGDNGYMEQVRPHEASVMELIKSFMINYQDEEWEREGLLDPAWEKQQRKVSFCFLYF